MAAPSVRDLPAEVVKEMVDGLCETEMPISYAKVVHASSMGTFTSLHTTLEVSNRRRCTVWNLWHITKETLEKGAQGASQPDLRKALSRLAEVVNEGAETLVKQLEGQRSERKQLMMIIEHVLTQLTGQPVVVNKKEIKEKYVKAPSRRDFLGIGTIRTWHGAPDARCAVDIVDVDLLADRNTIDGNLSESSTGAKTGTEMKSCNLGVQARNQVIGNVVTYSFVHNNRHPSQNPLVPELGLSGSRRTVMIALYDSVKDILLYSNPCTWLHHTKAKFSHHGLLLIWLALHHHFLLNRVTGEFKSGLHEIFEADGVLNVYKMITQTNRQDWPSIELEYRVNSSSNDSSPPRSGEDKPCTSRKRPREDQ